MYVRKFGVWLYAVAKEIINDVVADDSQLFAIFSVIFITFWSSQGNLSSKKSEEITEQKNVSRLV